MNTHQILRGILRNYRLCSPFCLKRKVSLYSKTLSTTENTIKNQNDLLNHQMQIKEMIKEAKDMKRMCHDTIKKTDMVRLKFKKGPFMDAGALFVFLPVVVTSPGMYLIVSYTLPMA